MQMLRKFVSQKKFRFQKEDFDLDLTYITPRIIAMGFPAAGAEGLYRNKMEEVQRFFKTYHDQHYRIYNLCEERLYPPEKFEYNVYCFPFQDHHPPPLRLFIPFCQNADEWLKANPKNVIAVHCKAGKGRTGVMLSAFLLYSGHVSSAKEAIEFFGRMRASDGHGVTLPSQLRYIGYFEKIFVEYYKMHVEIPPSPRKHLHRIVILKTPNVDRDGGCDLYFDVYQEQRLVYSGKSIFKSRRVVRQDVFVFDDLPLVLRGDLRFHFYDRDLIGRSTELFYFWTNTLFELKRVSRFGKYEIDKAHKDRKSKIFRPDFAVELHFEEGD